MADVGAIIKKHKIHLKPNVIGWSLQLMPKIVKGVETGEMAIRIYVTKKVPKALLKPEDVIPDEINGIKTDVVEIGRVKALANKTAPFRPMKFGISVGHWDVTAGTLCIPFEYRGEPFLSSNAHVLVPDPRLHPWQMSEVRILQPGRYDIEKNNLGNPADFVVGEYIYHIRIMPMNEPSNCAIAEAIAHVYNTVAQHLGRKTRLKPITYNENYVDFAIFMPTADYLLEFVDMAWRDEGFVGLLFAGSETTTIICKSKNIEKLGFKPIIKSAEPSAGDAIEKEGRTTCHTSGRVLDPSAAVVVDYADFEALFVDVIVSDLKSQGGDSGSPVLLKQ
ncbi:MAG: hypothetical protein QXD69_05945 [Candidatus Bathyarchaeia archaeon]